MEKANADSSEMSTESSVINSNISKLFQKAFSFINNKIPEKNYIYKAPWIIVLGDKKSGIAENLNLPTTFDESYRNDKSAEVKWKFFDNGVVMDISDDAEDDRKKWEQVLSSYNSNRPQRPLDGAVVTIPVEELLPTGDEDNDFLRMKNKAKKLFKSITSIQVKNSINIPVYVLLSQSEVLKGFTSLANEIPEKYTNDIFGWSNTYQSDKAFSESWIDEMFDIVTEKLNFIKDEIFVDNDKVDDIDSLVIFSEEVKKAEK